MDGGFVPLGYDVNDRKLLVNEREAATIRMVFERFVKIGSTTTLVRALPRDFFAKCGGSASRKGIHDQLLARTALKPRSVEV